MVATVRLVGIQSQIVLIDSLNEKYNSDHSQGALTLDVHPGDKIDLSADLFNLSDSGYQPQNQSLESFTWGANDQASDSCDASSSDDCLDTSNFQVNDYGVSFYVPATMGQTVQISVVDTSNPTAGTDTITLNNVDYVANYTLPTRVVTSPDAYPCNAFNADCALAGQGSWVYIDGQRFWAPYLTEVDWVPYSHGYWTWTDQYGWVWTSYDSWGWYTDHYGYWRHHGVYGWIWSPFGDNQYRPHTVTWFYDNDHIGWYPYYNGYAHAYDWDDSHGFDDGYWRSNKRSTPVTIPHTRQLVIMTGATSTFTA